MWGNLGSPQSKKKIEIVCSVLGVGKLVVKYGGSCKR